MMFGTADFGRDYIRTGDPSAEEALHTGNYIEQQAAVAAPLFPGPGRPAAGRRAARV